MDGRPQAWDLIWDGMGDWDYSISAVNFLACGVERKRGVGIGIWRLAKDWDFWN